MRAGETNEHVNGAKWVQRLSATKNQCIWIAVNLDRVPRSIEHPRERTSERAQRKNPASGAGADSGADSGAEGIDR